MIILKHKERDDRVFMPDGEAEQIPGWEAKGYVRWFPTVALPEIEIASEPAAIENVERQRQPVDFATVKNITPEMRDILHSRNILDWGDVLQVGVVAIANLAIDGLGIARARALFAVAQREAQ